MTTEFPAGTKVTVAGRRGTFIVHSDTPNRDGSLIVYGGSNNPNAVRMFRNVMPDKMKVVPMKRRRKDAGV